ncbi:MAG: hypothetical protein P3B98_09120 [Gemmatimonadota bacterium]|nr:hypothetical protein [Gemmatimonadota bacterium]
MHTSRRELTHPSWRRDPEPDGAPRESLMSQMVRAQLIFDRRTPPAGLPAWRDAEAEAMPVRLDARIGRGAGEFLVGAPIGDEAALPPVLSLPGEPSRFAEELAERLQLAKDRVEAEHVHLTQVGTVADAYLGRPNLRLVK